MGISTLSAGFALHSMLFNDEYKILVIATKQEVAKNLIEKVQLMYEFLPNFLKAGIKIENNNKLQLVLSNGSSIKAVSSSPNAGRSEGLSLLIIDEAAHVDYAEEIWTAAQPTLSTGGKCIILSTPNGQQGLFYRIWQQAEEGTAHAGAKFNPISLPWYLHPERDQSWRDEQDNVLGKREAAQECDCDFLTSGNTVIDPEILQFCTTKLEEPIEKRGIGGDLWIWKYPEITKSYLVCLPPEENILTLSGNKQIQDIQKTDILYDECGQPTNITDIKIRNYDGKLFEIKPSNTRRSTKFTDEHPILVSKPILKRNYNKSHVKYKFNERYWDFDFNFVPAKNVEIGDWIKVPNIYKNNTLTNDDILKYWEPFNDICRVDFRIDCPLLNPDFWWYVGMWLAEGWVYLDKLGIRKITTAHNSNESDILDRITTIMRNIANRTVGRTYRTEDNSAICFFTQQQIGSFLSTHFGSGAGGKYIPEWVKYLPIELKRQLVLGYLQGDGSTDRNSRRQDLSITFMSISLNLLEGIQDILFSLGYITSLCWSRKAGTTTIRGRTHPTKDKYKLILSKYDTFNLLHELNYRVDWITNIPENNRIISNCFFEKDKSYIYFRVKDITLHDYNGPVYNFSTTSGTFMCENITTHNCGDPARGDGEDYSGLVVMEVESNEQVAEFKGKIDTQTFGRMCVSLGMEYNNALLIIDNKNVGWSTVQVALDAHYPNLYYSYKNDPFLDENIHLRKMHDLAQKEDMVPGLTTTTRIRPVLISKLEMYFRDFGVLVRSKRLLNELKVFMWLGGKAQAQRGYNDDLVMALSMALYIRDTSLKLHQMGVDLNRFALKNTYKSVYKPLPAGSSQWEMQIGPNGQKENLKWLLR